MPDIVPTTVVVEPGPAAGGMVVDTDVVGIVPVMGENGDEHLDST